MTAMRAVEVPDPDGVLASARAARARVEAASLDVLVSAVQWASLFAAHRLAESERATWAGTDQQLSVAGDGAPSLPESCVFEFAAAVGLSTEAGKALLADGLELSVRLPRLYARVCAGEVAVWRARRIAQRTVALPKPGADFADRHLTAVAHRVGLAQVERTINEARARFAIDEHLDAGLSARDGRGVWVRPEVSLGGTVRVEAELAYADAVDFDTAVSREARLLLQLGSPEDSDARRAAGVGVLARRQLALDLTGDDEAVVVPATTPVSLYFHLTQPEAPTPTDAFEPADQASPVVMMGNGRGHVWDLESFLAFLETSVTKITVKPVADLTTPIEVSGYRPSPQQIERLHLVDGHCVFPHCSRPARPPGARSHTDADHVIPWPEGHTTTDNLAPLCRTHHRAKTHHNWSYVKHGPRLYTWTSPRGVTHIVNLN